MGSPETETEDLAGSPETEMNSFQGKDMIGEEGTRREGTCGDWDEKDFSAAWLSKPQCLV